MEADSCTVSTAPVPRSKTNAAVRKSQPTSTVCAVCDLFNELTFLAIGSIENHQFDCSTYNLKELCEAEFVTYDEDDCVEKTGKNYIDTILSGVMKDAVSYFDTEIDAFKNLPDTVYSSRQRPDVSVLIRGFVILLLEIESCASKYSFNNTIRKTILGLIDTIRYFRAYGMSSVFQWAGFTFPKLHKKAGVVKVTVNFDINTFKFMYTLENIAFAKVKEVVSGTYVSNLGNFNRIRLTDFKNTPKYDYYMVLTERELEFFGNGMKDKVFQLKSRQSVLLKGAQVCYKFPVRTSTSAALLIVSQALLGKASGFAIELTTHSDLYKCVSYEYVSQNPLVEDEVELCLGDFVCKVAPKIRALHQCEFGHLDLRIDNICFNDNFEPILIDLDRATSASLFGSKDIYPNSVMYNSKFDLYAHDWLQLGCIILWALTRHIQGTSYHNQTLSVDHQIVRDKFFLSLYNHGKTSEK